MTNQGDPNTRINPKHSDAAASNSSTPFERPLLSGRFLQVVAGIDRNFGAWLRPEVVFWRLGLVFGLLFVFITPPFQSPDENWHFYRSYQVSEGTMGATKFDEATAGGWLPRSLLSTVDEISSGIKFQPKNKQSLDLVMAHLSAYHAPLEPTDRTIIEFPQQALSSPVSYLPQAAGLAVGRLLRLSPLGLTYVARLSNLLVALLLTRWAIRICPLMPWGMVLLAMTPMGVFQRSTMSPDALLNAAAFLFIAVILRAAFAKGHQLFRGELWLIGGLAVVLGQCKPPYLLLTLLYFLIPAVRYGGMKKYWLIFLGIFAANLLFLGLWTIFTKEWQVPNPEAPNTIVALRDGRDTSRLPAEQIEYLQENPLRLITIFANTIREYSFNWLVTYLGKLGWLDTSLSWNIRWGVLGMLFLVAFFEGDPQRQLSARQRLLMLTVFVMVSAALAVALYVIWCATRGEVIDGLQGRYFIPISPLLFMPLTLQRGWIDFQRWRIPLLISLFLIGVLSLTLKAVVFRYYIPTLPM